MRVRSVGPDNATLEYLDGDPAYEFIEEPIAVYAVDSYECDIEDPSGWTFTYIGLEGLEADDYVYWYVVGNGDTYHLLLRLDFQPGE